MGTVTVVWSQSVPSTVTFRINTGSGTAVPCGGTYHDIVFDAASFPDHAERVKAVYAGLLTAVASAHKIYVTLDDVSCVASYVAVQA